MYYSGYAFKTDEQNKSYNEAKEIAKKKLERSNWKIEKSWHGYGKSGYEVQFENIDTDITEMDVISGIASMPFGGTCYKIAPGRFEVMEYND